MAQGVKAHRKSKRRGADAAAAPPGAAGLAAPADGPAGDEPLAAWPVESPDAGRADIERVDEHSPESIDSITEAAADDGSTGAIETATADPAQAQAPPHLVER